MAFRPKFDKYFDEEWIYNSSEGVGMKLSGYPNDITAFIDLLHKESCNPVATRRILDTLKNEGVKFTTLRSHLNFDNIGDALALLGVAMTIVPPQSWDKLQNQDIDYLAFKLSVPNKTFNFKFNLNPEEELEAHSRAKLFKNSFEENPSTFGNYA